MERDRDPEQPDDPSQRPYTESPVITKTVRLVVPFVATFGLFTMFHGTSSVGGGFQGGVVVAAAVVTIAFAFGVAQTGRWVDRGLVTGLAVVGVVVFAVVALGSLAFGGRILELLAFPGEKTAVYAIEAVEIGIGATVAAAIVVFFFEIAGAFDGSGGER